MAHLLVTNDFPPKIGGIQSYLWELWRRLPPGEAVVMTTPHAESADFDRAAPMPIIRTRQRWLLPTPSLERQILRVARQHQIGLIVLDPALPVGWLARRLRRKGFRVGVVVHGAEVTVPGRLPGTRQLLAGVLRNVDLVVAAGGYPLAEAERAANISLPSIVIAPGIDIRRFTPTVESAKPVIRERLGLPRSGPLLVSTSRLVPRKGRDVLIAAGGRLVPEFPDLCIAISGSGRDLDRLRKLAKRQRGLDVRFVGRLSDEDLADLYRCADLFVMLCRNRWGGLEQEGFGIVFLEAAASGVAQVAGRSGGSHEAVAHNETGVIVDRPRRSKDAAVVIAKLLNDATARGLMGEAGRRRVVTTSTYDLLAERLNIALRSVAEQQIHDESINPA